MRIIHSFIKFSALATVGSLLFISCNQQPKTEEVAVAGTDSISQFVFQTDSLKRYKFPTHMNDIIVDRAQSSHSEVFMVIIEPKMAPPLHKHDDTEQVFYIIEGKGVLTIGQDKKQFPVKPGDVVRIPVSCWHSIEADSTNTMKYICVDCFGKKPVDEPTWESHVRVVCKNNGWDFDKVVNLEY